MFASPVLADESKQKNTQWVQNPVFSGKTYVEQWGDPKNPAVMLVHGLGNNGAKDWQYLAPELSKHYYVVAFDLPGFGRSGKYNELYSLDNYVRFLNWVANRFIEKPFVLIGHSMGGAISLNYASQHNDRLQQLILIDAAGILHRAAFSKHIIDGFKPTQWWDYLPGTNTELLNNVLGIDLAQLDQFPVALDLILATSFTRNQFLGGDPAKIAALALVQHDFSGKLRNVRAPTLIIWGERDPIAPLRTGKLLAHRLPNARLKVISEAEHTPMLTHKKQLNQLVLARLRGDPIAETHKATGATNSGKPKNDQCQGKREAYFSGNYDRLIIEKCERVTIEHARIRYLKITDSNVVMVDSIVEGGNKALEIDNSALQATVSEFNADIPVIVNNSRLDLAGVTINAKTRAFKPYVNSSVVFSLCEMHTPRHSGPVHGIHRLSAADNPL